MHPTNYGMSKLPQMFRLRQHLPRPRVADVPALVRAELQKLALDKTIRPGATIAVPAGSRGIADIVPVLKTVVEHLRSIGAEPFLVPAMGSHGGATAEGQLALLASLGVTEDACDCPIRSSMETVDLVRASAGFPIRIDRLTSEADHVLIVGRVKPHTIYGGDFQSGLAKMLIVGLGNRDGAKQSHRVTADLGFDALVRDVVPQLLDAANVIGGLALLENPFDETAHIEAVAPGDFLTREPELLKMAAAWLPGLPFHEVDVLLVDEIGKNISGSGMDTNVIGRKADTGALDGRHSSGTSDASPAEGAPATCVRRIVVRSLTAASRGNALGVGLADLCTKRLADAIDQDATWTNGLTSGNIDAVKLPPVVETDRAALDAALSLCGLTEPEEARVLWIKNTSEVAELACSAAYQEAARQRDDLQLLSPLAEWPFDARDNLPPTVQDWR